MGIKITTDEKGVKIWRSDRYGFPNYAIAVSKNENGTWVKQYQQIRFRKGVELQNGTVIYIRNAFPVLDTWVKDQKEYTKIVWFIDQFETDDQSMQSVQTGFNDLPDTFSALDDDMPY